MKTLMGQLIDNIKQVIIGKDDIIEYMVICLLNEGHILLEGAPGLGKTKLAHALAISVEGHFKRLQFTPDVLPSDVTGFNIYNQQTCQFEYREGAASCHFLLADEINRASPRVQSSLLEAMEERQVTVEGKTYRLPDPFMVIATQNTIESEGTYPLPEAQMDRFFMKLQLDYPTRAEWEQILDQSEGVEPLKNLKEVLELEALASLQKQLQEVQVSKAVKGYILDLAEAIREHDLVERGSSPRGTIALLKGTRGAALLRGRSYALPDDVQHVLIPIIAHRLILKPEAEWNNIQGKDVLKEILSFIKPPIFHV